jgi:hypothetical protein
MPHFPVIPTQLEVVKLVSAPCPYSGHGLLYPVDYKNVTLRLWEELRALRSGHFARLARRELFKIDQSSGGQSEIMPA